MTSMTGGVPRLDCVTAMRQLWDFLDGELTPEREAAVRRHIEECAGCLPHAEWGERFLAALGAVRRMDGATPAPLRERVLRALGDAGWSAG